MGVQDILKYFKIVRKWWWVIGLLVAVTVGTMAAVAYLAETEYQATVTLQVSAPPPQEVPLYSQFGWAALRDAIEQTQASFSEFLKGSDVPWQVIKTVPDVYRTADELMENVEIETIDNSQLMYIHVRASNSETAALLANTLIDIGLRSYDQLLAKPTSVTRRFIEQELEIARIELEKAETELIQFQVDNKVGSLNSTISSQQDLIRSLQTQRDVAQAEGDTAKSQALDKIVLDREAELQNLLGLSAAYNSLNSRVDRARTTYNFLLDKKTEAQIKENQILEVGSIQIITPARPPDQPVLAISPKIIALGAVVSILVGILLAFFLEYLEVSGALRPASKRISPAEVASPILD